MNFFKKIGRDGTKMAWIAIILIVAAVVTGLWLLPMAATQWKVLVQFKDNIYDLIGKLFTIIVLPVANEIRKTFESKGGNTGPPKE
jgi:hypothetical protein